MPLSILVAVANTGPSARGELAEAKLALVRAKCLYALEVQAGDRAGPYSDEAATRYAQTAFAHRHQARSRAPRRR